MFSNNSDKKREEIQDWERELLANHRWGRFKKWFPGEQISLDSKTASKEHAHLKNLWNKAQPLDQSCKDTLNSIIALEICNWNFENSIMNLCSAIGRKEKPTLAIGHYMSITDERWKQIWAYYLILRNWLPCEGINGYEVILNSCDPDKRIQKHILNLLGERDKLKELYVEYFCLLLESWIGIYFEKQVPQKIAHDAAVLAITKEIRKIEPKSSILKSIKRLKLPLPCNHKAFRHYDIIISSIGANKWRATIPQRGTDGLERAALLDKYLSILEMWIKGYKRINEQYEDRLINNIHNLLGEPDDTKIFLVSLLISLLRPQQMAAKHLAEKRLK